MDRIDRLQCYLRQSARRQYESVALPGLCLFFHRTDELTFFNYAIPESESGRLTDRSLDRMRAEFRARRRVPRFEYIGECFPELAAKLERAGFVQEACQTLMVCTAATQRSMPVPPEIAITELDRRSDPADVRLFLSLQYQAFGEPERTPTQAEAVELIRSLGCGKAWLARWKGEPAGAGLLTSPIDGVAELAGLATLELFRRRGIATTISGRAVEVALTGGVELVCLTAADRRVGRVYRRVGFQPAATMLAYIDTPSPPAIGGD